MKIAICDPSLSDDKGHHLEYQIALTNSILSRQKNIDILWYVNKSHTLEPEKLNAKIKVLGYFDLQFYKPEAFDIEKWSEDLYNVLADCEKKEVTKLIYHTSIGDDFKCLLPLILEYENIEFHMCTPYSPRYMPGSTKSLELVKTLKQLQEFPNFWLWAETIELSDYYLSLGIKCGFLGIPTWDEKIVREHSQEIKNKYSKNLTISYIGPARNEKKFFEFAQVIHMLSKSEDRSELSKIEKVFVSIIEPKRGYSKEVKDGIELLENIENLNIEFCSDALDRESYIQQISVSQLIWLAYDQQAYGDGRGSGILVDCLAAGTCFIARAGTTPQNYLRGNGFIIDDIKHSTAKILEFIKSVDAKGRASIKMQEHFLSNYSISVLNEKLGFDELSKDKQNNEICSMLSQGLNTSSSNFNKISVQYSLCIVTTTLNGEATILKTIASICQQDPTLNIRYHIQISAKTIDNTLKQIEHLSEVISQQYKNIAFSWSVSSDKGLYDGLMKAFNHVLPECSDETWLSWINDDDQILPDAGKILHEISNKFPYVNLLTSIPAVRGTNNSNNREFRLSPELVRLGLYDGTNLPFIQQEGTFFKCKIWNKHLSKISVAWSNLKLAGDYFLWKQFASSYTIFYLYNEPLAIFRSDTKRSQLSSDKDKYQSEIETLTSKSERAEIIKKFQLTKVGFDEHIIRSQNWSLTPDFIEKTNFKITKSI